MVCRKKCYISLFFLVVLVCVLFLSGCGKDKAEQIISDDISSTFDALCIKEGDTYDTMKSGFCEAFQDTSGIDEEELFDSLLNGFDYTIDKVVLDEDGKRATVTVTVTCKTIDSVITKWISKLDALDKATFDGMDENEMSAYANDILMQSINEAKLVSSTFEINYAINGEGAWDLAEDEHLDGLVSALLGNLDTENDESDSGNEEASEQNEVEASEDANLHTEENL